MKPTLSHVVSSALNLDSSFCICPIRSSKPVVNTDICSRSAESSDWRPLTSSECFCSNILKHYIHKYLFCSIKINFVKNAYPTCFLNESSKRMCLSSTSCAKRDALSLASARSCLSLFRSHKACSNELLHEHKN